MRSLERRFERLLKQVQSLAKHCEQTPDRLREKLKQLLDLALIELEEGYQTLFKYQAQPEVPKESAGLSAVQPGIERAPIPAESEEVPDGAAGELEVLSAHDCEQRIESALDDLESGLEELANFAAIPEAADLQTILARLAKGIEASEGEVKEEPELKQQARHHAREQLLSFEICRMAPESAELKIAAVSAGDSPLEPESVCPLQVPATSREIRSQAPVAGKAQYLVNDVLLEASVVAGMSAALDGLPMISAAADKSVEMIATDSESDAGKTPTNLNGQESQAVKPSSPKDARASETVENISPLESISPDNLQAILSLKQELEELSAQFKQARAG